MAVRTPLGKDVLLLESFTAMEAISEPFSFILDVIFPNRDESTGSGKSEPNSDQLLGQSITVELQVPTGGTRYFNGICNRVTHGEQEHLFTGYRLELVPQFWYLTKKTQSRIFSSKNVPDILKAVLTGLNVTFQIEGTFEPRDYCVQYRESDFQFASRLMEEEGIYYFFKHTSSGHQMVIANTPGGHPKVDGLDKANFKKMERASSKEGEILGWEKVQELRAGKVTLWDHCFELPHKHLEAQKTIKETVAAGGVNHKLKVGGNDKLELYDFPGDFALRFDGVTPGGGNRDSDIQKIFQDNSRTAQIRMEQETSRSVLIRGASTYPQFTCGHKFTMGSHPQKADGSYVLASVLHSARIPAYRSEGKDGGFLYSNHFTCIPQDLPFRPTSGLQKPVMVGTQTAVVVGPKGQEIFTDKYGRVKVQFHWDRQGKNDADSSCWVRVAQVWAGKRWGASFWPRIGQEVVVAFEEGDPDQPIIIGSVYNADQMPPYLGNGPDTKHQNDNKLTGIKSNTTPDGKGFNELRFDDTKDKQQIFVHAERNLDSRVKNESMERVISNRHLIVGWKSGAEQGDYKEGGDQRELVYQDKHLNVKRNQVELIEGDCQLTVGGDEQIVIKKNKKELITEDSHLHIKGQRLEKIEDMRCTDVAGDVAEVYEKSHSMQVISDRKESVGGNQSLSVSKNQQEKVGQRHALEAGTEIHIKAGTSLVLEAGVQLSLKVGGNFVNIDATGVSISGTMVMINSGGAAGSGSGSSPDSPGDIATPDDAKEASPTKPTMADDAVSGFKSAPSN
jgi:type VI secretion system secreted protein VgrG